MEWINDPSAWLGLATLVLLEIILGIDNLVFIAILADKLPPHQRNKARIIGLSLALGMRLILLASIAWVVTLTNPLFSVFSVDISGRDLILLTGGLFLIFKATMELHARLEGDGHQGQGKIAHAVFWQVIVQIVVLDAVFSLDSVITAVGMVDELSVMMIAVVIAMIIMMIASKPLMAFVSKHPTVVILCLGFLMMIGFSLVVEGFGFHIPKGYLYAAIAFSIMIEAFNQMARRNRQRLAITSDLRERAANAVLAMLGGRRRGGAELGETVDVIAEYTAGQDIFAPEQTQMIEGVLALDRRSAKSIMTPRIDVDWLDLDAPEEELHRRIREMKHSRLPLGRGSLDNFVGVAITTELLQDLLSHGRIDPESLIHQPLVIHKSVSILRLTEQLRHSPLQMAVVLDEYGSLEGVVTSTDILEAIAGEFADEDEEQAVAEQGADGSWLVDGSIEIRRISALISADLVDKTDHYSTLAGYLLWQLGHLPTEGERLQAGGFIFEIVGMEDHSISKVRITPAPDFVADEGLEKTGQRSGAGAAPVQEPRSQIPSARTLAKATSPDSAVISSAIVHRAARRRRTPQRSPKDSPGAIAGGGTAKPWLTVSRAISHSSTAIAVKT
jgi:CBS domain containing-hemolysin-like protein